VIFIIIRRTKRISFQKLRQAKLLGSLLGEILPDSEQIFPLEKNLRLLKINSLISEYIFEN